MGQNKKLKAYNKSVNPITGDRLVTKAATDDYRRNYSHIFGESKLEKKLKKELSK